MACVPEKDSHGLQDEPSEALQSITGLALAILVDKKKAVPEALLKAAALLHDSALLVRPKTSPLCSGTACTVVPCARKHPAATLQSIQYKFPRVRYIIIAALEVLPCASLQ